MRAAVCPHRRLSSKPHHQLCHHCYSVVATQGMDGWAQCLQTLPDASKPFIPLLSYGNCFASILPKGGSGITAPSPAGYPGGAPILTPLCSGAGGCFALCPCRGICPSSFSTHQGGESRQERSWRKTTREQQGCTKAALFPPPGTASPPSPAMENPAQRSPSSPPPSSASPWGTKCSRARKT